MQTKLHWRTVRDKMDSNRMNTVQNESAESLILAL